MTRLDAMLEHYARTLDALRQDAKRCRPRPGDHEPVTPERLARCAARKAEQLRRARELGLLPEEVHA